MAVDLYDFIQNRTILKAVLSFWQDNIKLICNN